MKCGVCGEPVHQDLGELELHDGSKLRAIVYEHGLHDDGRPHWREARPVHLLSYDQAKEKYGSIDAAQADGWGLLQNHAGLFKPYGA